MESTSDQIWIEVLEVAELSKLENDTSVVKAVRLFLLERLDELEKEAAHLTDPEQVKVKKTVHALRVICRQILSTLYAFSPYLCADRFRMLRRSILRINGLLGPVRDLDILLKRADLEPNLLKMLRRKRTSALSELMDELSCKRLRRLSGMLAMPLMMPDADLRLAPPALAADGRVRMRRLSMVVPEVLYRLAADIYAYQAVVRSPQTLIPATSEPDEPAAPDGPDTYDDIAPYNVWNSKTAQLHPSEDVLHRLRISCKRFRYTVTMLQPLFGSQADSLINDCKKLQDLLGLLHDHQMLVKVISKNAKKAKGTDLSDYPISQNIQHEYEQLLQSFFSFWQTCDQGWFHQRIKPLIDSVCPQANSMP